MSSKSPCDVGTYTLQQAICGMDHQSVPHSFAHQPLGNAVWRRLAGGSTGAIGGMKHSLQSNDVSWGIAAVQRFLDGPIKPYRDHAGGELWAFLASHRL